MKPYVLLGVLLLAGCSSNPLHPASTLPAPAPRPVAQAAPSQPPAQPAAVSAAPVAPAPAAQAPAPKRKHWYQRLRDRVHGVRD